MKALLFERNVPRFAAARVASALAGSGKGVRVGPLELVEVDASELPGPGWVRVAAPPRRHLRLGPRHLGRPQLALLRADRQLPLRSRPRDRRRRRRAAPSTAGGS